MNAKDNHIICKDFIKEEGQTIRDRFVQIGRCLGKLMQEMTKYGYSFTKEALSANINRLTNQLWKLIPMRENNENWINHLSALLVEIGGFGELYNNTPLYINLLSKLEGL